MKDFHSLAIKLAIVLVPLFELFVLNNVLMLCITVLIASSNTIVCGAVCAVSSDASKMFSSGSVPNSGNSGPNVHEVQTG